MRVHNRILFSSLQNQLYFEWLFCHNTTFGLLLKRVLHRSPEDFIEARSVMQSTHCAGARRGQSAQRTSLRNGLCFPGLEKYAQNLRALQYYWHFYWFIICSMPSLSITPTALPQRVQQALKCMLVHHTDSSIAVFTNL